MSKSSAGESPATRLLARNDAVGSYRAAGEDARLGECRSDADLRTEGLQTKPSTSNNRTRDSVYHLRANPRIGRFPSEWRSGEPNRATRRESSSSPCLRWAVIDQRML